MLHYPKIPSSKDAPLGRCIAFEKYDGTNLHWDWDRDFGWHSFGTRRDAFNLTPQGIEQFVQRHAHLHEAPALFQTTLAEGLERIFLDNPTYKGFAEFAVFTEFLGPNSFAGLHRADDPKELVLFDVRAGSFGMIGPEQFVRDFGQLAHCPRGLPGQADGQVHRGRSPGQVRRGRGRDLQGRIGRQGPVDVQDQDGCIPGAAEAGLRGEVGGILGVRPASLPPGIALGTC